MRATGKLFFALMLAAAVSACGESTSPSSKQEATPPVENSLAQLQKQADSGDATAQSDLGWMYDNGEDVPKDAAKAVEWWQKAAAQGHANAQSSLGWMYAKGNKETKFHRLTGRKQYSCQYCGHHVAPCAGTIFEKSSTSLKDWFYAMYLFTSTRHGVPAKELERQLGVTYKTAWRMGHKLRELMYAADSHGPLGGIVEADESYFGGKRKFGYGTEMKGVNKKDGKTIVFGMIERGFRVRAGVVEKVKIETLKPIIKRHIAPGSTLHTDEGRWYNHVSKEGYKHESVHHASHEYVRGNVHVNSMEGFWSRIKNSIKGTHIHVSKKHMNKYLSEFAYRHNSRHAPALMFFRLLSGVVKPYQAT